MDKAKNMVTIDSMKLRGRDYAIVAVASLEQVIGAALSTVIGIMLPMLQMISHPELSSGLQGFIGACGLIGIAIGSLIIGRLSDKHGYLLWFRLCPVIIIAGSAAIYFFPTVGVLIPGMIFIGIGVGGGYSLDSAYISELMPKKWQLFMVGVAKATCSIGFIGAAVIAMIVLKANPSPELWRSLIWIIGGMGAVTLLLRIKWWESPRWLMAHGMAAKAEAVTRKFLGDNVVIEEPAATDDAAPKAKSVSWGDMFKGENLRKVIFSGVPWACEGLGVYGFGVFLPVLVMALGIEHEGVTGMPRIINSVEVTAIVNFFILPGFVIGLLILNRVNHVKMLYGGFIGAAIGLLILLVGYTLKLPSAILIAGFVIYEITLNMGPHLITFIIPSAIYPVENRGAGSGIAAMTGKIGAILGVILMPILLDLGGATLVLIVSTAVMLLGALISIVYGRMLKLM